MLTLTHNVLERSALQNFIIQGVFFISGYLNDVKKLQTKINYFQAPAKACARKKGNKANYRNKRKHVNLYF